MQLVLAPVAGRVAALPVAAGQPVSRWAATVAVIVPQGSQLEAELLAPPRAVGFVRPGQEVSLMLQAFPHQRFGTVKGMVRAMSNTVLGPDRNLHSRSEHPGAGLPRPRDAAERTSSKPMARPSHCSPECCSTADIVFDRRSLVDGCSILCSQWEAVMSVLEQLNFSRRRRLPLVLASEAAECGLACIAMVARFHGHDVDLNGLRQRFALSMSGISLRNLMGLADQLGFSTRPLRVELSALSKVRMPAILHWDVNHFVVLNSISAKGAVIHDPAIGVRKVPLADLSKHFTGVVLELAPAASFRPVHASAPIRLKNLWSQMTGTGPALAQVIALSVVLQIAAFAAPFQIQLVIDEAVFHADRDLLAVLALAFGALVIVQASVEVLRGWSLRVFGHLLSFQIVGNLIHHMLRLPADFFEKRHVGDILSRIGAVQPIQDAITRGVVASIIDGVMALIAAGILLFYSVTLGAIVVFAFLLHLGLVFALYPGMRHRMEEEILARAKEQSHLIETVRAATIIKLMGREAERESAWRNLYAEVTNAGISVGKYQISFAFIQTLLSGLVNVIIIFLGARLILAGEGFSVGMLFAFLSFRNTFNERAVGLINQLVQFRLLGCISTASPISSPPFPRPKPQRRRASTPRAQSRFASCRSATASPTSSCSRTSTSRSRRAISSPSPVRRAAARPRS